MKRIIIFLGLMLVIFTILCIIEGAYYWCNIS